MNSNTAVTVVLCAMCAAGLIAWLAWLWRPHRASTPRTGNRRAWWEGEGFPMWRSEKTTTTEAPKPDEAPTEIIR